MILDTSAILGVLFHEKDASDIIREIRSAQFVGVGSPTLVEVSIVLGSRIGFENLDLISEFLQMFQVAVMDFNGTQWQLAAAAFQQYGKGRHPASLNFGDCLSYAAAKGTNQRLLSRGNDFSQTDLV